MMTIWCHCGDIVGRPWSLQCVTVVSLCSVAGGTVVTMVPLYGPLGGTVVIVVAL